MGSSSRRKIVKGTQRCRGALSPLPDLWAVQWDRRQLGPLKDYLYFLQAFWDNLSKVITFIPYKSTRMSRWGNKGLLQCVCCSMCSDMFVYISCFPNQTCKFSSIYRNHVHMFMPFFVCGRQFWFWYQTTDVMYCISVFLIVSFKDAEWFSPGGFRVFMGSFASESFPLLFLSSHTP